MTNDKLLHKWIHGELTGEELEAFKRRPEYKSLEELYKNTEGLTAPGFKGEAMLAEILKKEKVDPSVGVTVRRVFLANWVKYAIAAAVVLFGGWFLFLKGDVVTYKVAGGERMEDVLPDQSVFVLNAESSLSFNKGSWKKDRSLQLSGEAFFTVKAGSAFTVHTPTGKVQVLGTKFNVWSRGNRLEVTCQEGSVAVLSQDGGLIDKLAPNDGIRIEPGKAPEKYQIPTADNASWVEGITKLRKATLGQVLEELERQFAIEINAGNVNLNEVVSCNFQHKDLELALKTALSQLDITYEIKDGKKVHLE